MNVGYTAGGKDPGRSEIMNEKREMRCDVGTGGGENELTGR